ncbi:MAG TPA: molybdopterin synthase sulfur carrier subunit [Desulfobulbaceae bacterium]|nr:molybdopterin synthase sulfur carrier subunit [Desulfobulbaceae bacterium]
MRVTIRLFANFRIGRFKQETREFDSTATVRHIVEALGIPDPEVGIIFINGRSGGMDQALAEGDTLSLFPLVGGG